MMVSAALLVETMGVQVHLRLLIDGETDSAIVILLLMIVVPRVLDVLDYAISMCDLSEPTARRGHLLMLMLLVDSPAILFYVELRSRWTWALRTSFMPLMQVIAARRLLRDAMIEGRSNILSSSLMLTGVV